MTRAFFWAILRRYSAKSRAIRLFPLICSGTIMTSTCRRLHFQPNSDTIFFLSRVITVGSNVRYIIHEDGTLEIQAVRASDVGEYSCVLHSPGGNETRSARLSVIELPFPPSHVSAKRVPSGFQRAVNVSWTPGFDGNAPILQYVIQRLEVNSNN